MDDIAQETPLFFDDDFCRKYPGLFFLLYPGH